MTENFCDIEFHKTYVIITFYKGIILDLKKAKLLRNKISEYYQGKSFVMISNREHKHQVLPEVYKKGQLKNMKGLAIVSKEKTEKDIAMTEQGLFHKSFAFFENLEDAKSWAKNFLDPYQD